MYEILLKYSSEKAQQIENNLLVISKNSGYMFAKKCLKIAKSEAYAQTKPNSDYIIAYLNNVIINLV